MTVNDMCDKIRSIINSCKTKRQLSVALIWCRMLNDKYYSGLVNANMNTFMYSVYNYKLYKLNKAISD
jgi:hypothetical protein